MSGSSRIGTPASDPIADKHAAVNKLLHDLNQPLTAISNYAQTGSLMLANGEVDPVRLKELFGKITEQCNRTNLLSQELGKAVTEIMPDNNLS